MKLITKWTETKLNLETIIYFVNGLALRLYTTDMSSELDPIKTKGASREKGARWSGNSSGETSRVKVVFFFHTSYLCSIILTQYLLSKA